MKKSNKITVKVIIKQPKKINRDESGMLVSDLKWFENPSTEQFGGMNVDASKIINDILFASKHTDVCIVCLFLNVNYVFSSHLFLKNKNKKKRFWKQEN